MNLEAVEGTAASEEAIHGFSRDKVNMRSFVLPHPTSPTSKIPPKDFGLLLRRQHIVEELREINKSKRSRSPSRSPKRSGAPTRSPSNAHLTPRPATADRPAHVPRYMQQSRDLWDSKPMVDDLQLLVQHSIFRRHAKPSPSGKPGSNAFASMHVKGLLDLGQGAGDIDAFTKTTHETMLPAVVSPRSAQLVAEDCRGGANFRLVHTHYMENCISKGINVAARGHFE